MRITNETHMRCPKCGAEATGLDDINKLFGYKIVKEVITPYSECRKCRGNQQYPKNRFGKRIYKDKQWASAACWGRRINISRTKFDSYLIDMGYLKHDFEGGEKGNKLVVTKEGRNHSATSNSRFQKMLLWDFDTYAKVVKMRASRAIVHDSCPKCKAYLDTMPDYNDRDYSHTCKRCGRVCEYWNVDVIYDR